MNRNCGNCGYYIALKDVERVGKCRRYPPTRTIVGTTEKHDFPQTLVLNWCGEHSSGKIINEVKENAVTALSDRLVSFLSQETPSAKAVRIIAEGLMEDDE